MPTAARFEDIFSSVYQLIRNTKTKRSTESPNKPNKGAKKKIKKKMEEMRTDGGEESMQQ